MRMVKIGKAVISGLCIGGNPFSGFTHQNEARDRETREYYTPARIKQTMREAEQAGVKALPALPVDAALRSRVGRRRCFQDGTVRIACLTLQEV